VPAWKCNNKVLLEKERLHFSYNSDCRGRSIFYPVVGGETLSQPQIPVTLPTYDEAIGHKGVSAANYNDYIFSLMKPEDLNVLTVHAEVEGISCAKMFDQFLKKARTKGISLVPLGSFLKENIPVGNASIVPGKMSGREGWISIQV
jgi:undecaprenyl phosphate-alpha-L-ara4FN deformylase